MTNLEMMATNAAAEAAMASLPFYVDPLGMTRGGVKETLQSADKLLTDFEVLGALGLLAAAVAGTVFFWPRIESVRRGT